MTKEELEEAIEIIGKDRISKDWWREAHEWNTPADADMPYIVAGAIEWLREHHGNRAVEAAFNRAADDADTGEILLHAVLEPPQFCRHDVFMGTLCLACEE